MSEIDSDEQVTPGSDTILTRGRTRLSSPTDLLAVCAGRSPAPSTDADLGALVGAGGDLQCECTHPDGPCEHPAEHRVSPQCSHPGCEGAQGVWLLCTCCWQTWMEQAEPGTITSRPLR
jgi:hypothetical protein